MTKPIRKSLFIAIIIGAVLVTGVHVKLIDLDAPASKASSKIVYVVTLVDAEMSEAAGHEVYIGDSNPHPTIDLSAYAVSPASTVSQVMNSNFRNSIRDSFGGAFKVTWFAEMDYLMSQGVFVYADDLSAGVSGYTAIRDILVNNWGTQIQTYGDSLEYHHHFMIYDGKWERYDKGPDAGYGDYQMYALDHMIIDRHFYPVTFDTGWHIMPPALSNWLDQWLPFDYSILDAIPEWYPMHSSDTARWAIPTDAPFASESGAYAAFETAESRGSAIYCYRMHDREDMVGNITAAHSWLVAATSMYPDVSFQYVTAAKAVQLALGWTDFTPPRITISPSGNAYVITSNELLWADHPYVALEYSGGVYTHVAAVKIGTNTWTVTPQSLSSLVKIGVAASDLFGNSGLATVENPRANISVGVNVTVDPASDLRLTFSNVTAEGYAMTNKTSKVEAPPLANLVGQYYDIEVTARYSGNVTVSLAYDDADMGLDRESILQMMQYTPILGDVVDYGQVNILDISFVAKYFKTTPDSLQWNATADIDENEIINILDLAKCAKNFGKTAEWMSITTYIDTELNIVQGETAHFSFIGIH